MTTVTSAELSKNFGRYRTAAHKNPITITSHGKEDLVLLDVDEYKRLKERDRNALFAWELDADEIEALKQGDIPESSKEFDHEIKA